MPRKKVTAKRKILPDPVFNSDLVAKFINCIMVSGKKSVAEKIVYGAFAFIATKKLAQEVTVANFVNGFAQVKATTKNSESDSENASSSEKNILPAVLNLFETALDNIRPTVEVRSRRVGGSTYQIPADVRPNRRNALAMRWLKESAQKRGEKSMIMKLANELMDALDGKGAAVKKREEVHKMANANRAFGHLSLS
ncbi:MAG: 30S ribosomal protein S7 [Legionellaceae bacterium]